MSPANWISPALAGASFSFALTHLLFAHLSTALALVKDRLKKVKGNFG